MINLRVRKIITVLLLSILILTFAIGLTACDKLEDREDYIEENGWIALITSEEYKTAKLIGNKEESVINGEAILPTNLKGYTINRIQKVNGLSLSLSCYDIYPDKLFVPGVNYSFSSMIGFPYANKKIIFLNTEPDQYSKGFNLRNDNHTCYPYKRSVFYYVPKTSLDAFESKYNEYTYGKFKGANVSYFYNYEDSPNSGYCWVDDLDAGDRIKTIPMAPQREGYGFGGWYLEEECITPFSFDSFIMTENGELNLYAKWIQR